MRLIDADALRAAMYHEAFETDSDLQRWDAGCWIRWRMFEKMLDAAPTIAEDDGWIPVTDRLPQDDEDVLVWVNGTHRDMAYRDEGVWYDEEHNHLKNITHWMPLPAPPKEDV